MATDTTRWAAQFGQNAMNMAQQSKAEAQNMLMAMFAEETARQRPLATMPIELAMNNAKLQQAAAMAPPTLSPQAEADLEWETFMREQGLRHRNDVELENVRHGNDLAEIKTRAKVTNDDETAPSTFSAVPEQDSNGKWFITTTNGSKRFITPEQAQRMLGTNGN